MPDSEKDRAAEEVVALWATFGLALSNKRRYPVQEFRAFVQIAQRYVEMTKDDPLIHKSVTRCVNGLREYLEMSPQDYERSTRNRDTDAPRALLVRAHRGLQRNHIRGHIAYFYCF